LRSKTCPNAKPENIVINFKGTIQTKNIFIFDKGNYKTVPTKFRTFGIISLEELSKFQERFKMHDTNTTIILLEMVLL